MKKNKKIAVLSVVFPSARRFLGDYLESLERQTYKDFDVIIVNDNVPDFGKISLRHDLNIREIPSGKNIARNRELGINYAKKEGYDYLVFSDSDDMSAPDRVEKSITLLEHNDVVVNDITTMDKNGKILKKHYIGRRIKGGSRIMPDFIRDKNICGFGNSAIRLSCLKEKAVFDPHLIAVDWYFFTSLIQKGCKAVFTDKTISYYRIYAGNMAGVGPRLNEAKIKSDLFIMSAHYKALAGKGRYFKDRYKKLADLQKNIKNSGYARAYIDSIKSRRDINPVWWEHIRLPEEAGL